MKVFHGLPGSDFYPETALALGFFDGLHLGHRVLLQAASESPYPCGVLSFETPPKKAGKRLQTNEEKLELLSELGMDFAILLPFTDEFSKLSPRDFTEQILKKGCHAKQVIVGENYRFGHNAEGTNETLRALADTFSVTVCPLLSSPYGTVSSTLIRELLSDGRVKEVNELLGRPYTLSGRVIHGQNLGQKMGMPTANLEVPEVLLPRTGVYETRVWVEGEAIPAITNIGFRPTVEGDDMSIESHLLNYDGPLYGKSLRVCFYRYLREERKFPDVETLFAQIRKDREAVLKDL